MIPEVKVEVVCLVLGPGDGICGVALLHDPLGVGEELVGDDGNDVEGYHLPWVS